mgnify:CR=1 FL=1
MMVDQIKKSLNKFTGKERESVKNLLLKISNTHSFNPTLKVEACGVGLDIKKLKGRDDIYRARKGKIRIIYRVDDKQIYVLAIEKRSDNTYRDL